MVAAMMPRERRAAYLDGVEKVRGTAARERIERDLQEPSVGCAWRIAAALHIPLGELFYETRTDSVAEPQTRGADRQTDALLKAYFKLSEQNRVLALGIIKLLDRNQREIPD